MNLYGYTIRQAASEPAGLRVTLFSLEDASKTQEFFLAGTHHDMTRVASHMLSLTDDQCDFWLNPERLRLKQEAERQAQKEERAARARVQALLAEQAKAQKAADKQKQKEKRAAAGK